MGEDRIRIGEDECVLLQDDQDDFYWRCPRLPQYESLLDMFIPVEPFDSDAYRYQGGLPGYIMHLAAENLDGVTVLDYSITTLPEDLPDLVFGPQTETGEEEEE